MTVEQPVGEPQQVLEGVEVSVRNVDSRLAVLEIQPAVIDVTVQGSADLLRNLTRNDIQAYVNLQGSRRPGWAVLTVEGVNVPRGVTLVNYAPSEIRVNLDDMIERRIDITPVLVGSPAEGYEVTDIGLEPRQVTVRGAATRVKDVERAEVELDIDGLSRERRFELPVSVVVSNPPAGLLLTPGNVTATIKIEPSDMTRRLPVRVPILGDPASGFVIEEMHVSPAEVMVRGRRDLLAGLDFALTQPLDVNGRSEDFEVELGWNLPTGVQVEEVGKATVSVRLGMQGSRP